MNLAWAYAFNVLINSTLTFLTVALLVQLLVWGLRIRHPRVQAFCFCLPFLKISIDFFFYDFSNWALSHQLNPFFAEPGTRNFSIFLTPYSTGINFSMADNKSFTLADLVVLSVDPIWIQTAVILTLLVTVSLSGLRIKRYFNSNTRLNGILERSSPCSRLVLNSSIQKALTKVRILSSSEIDVPCAARSRMIIFPEKLLGRLSQKEFEAIIVHELDHLRWKDVYLRTAQELISTFFWWIPTKRWRSRLERAQEVACDAKISYYGLSPIDLARAITKTAKESRSSLPVMTFTRRVFILSRLEELLHPIQHRRVGVKIVLLAVFLIPIFLGQFWIF